jgi:hypothetical protein
VVVSAQTYSKGKKKYSVMTAARGLAPQWRLIALLFAMATFGRGNADDTPALDELAKELAKIRRHAASAGYTCSIPIYPNVGAGMAAQQANASHPFVVRRISSTLGKRHQQPLSRIEYIENFGGRRDHYDGRRTVRDALGLGESVLSSEPRIAGTEVHEHDVSLVAFGGTEGAGTSTFGMIFGFPGCGVINDFHEAAFFHALVGRKVWLFTHQAVHESNCRHCQQADSFCSHHGLFEEYQNAGALACVLEADDFLFAPEGWYHNTCHLDETVSLIKIGEGAEYDSNTDAPFDAYGYNLPADFREL